MKDYEKKILILEYLNNNLAKGDSYNRFTDLENHLKTHNSFPENQRKMITTSLIKKGFIELYDSHGKIDFGNEQIKISDTGRIYVESRRTVYSRFMFWAKQNDNYWKIINPIIGFVSGFIVSYLTKKC